MSDSSIGEYSIIHRRGEDDWLGKTLGPAISATEYVHMHVEAIRIAHKDAAESKQTHEWKNSRTYGYDRHNAVEDELARRARIRGGFRVNSTQSFVLRFGDVESYAFRYNKKPKANIYSCRLPEGCVYIRRALHKGPARQIPLFGATISGIADSPLLVAWAGDMVEGVQDIYFGQATEAAEGYLDWIHLDQVHFDPASTGKKTMALGEAQAVGENPHASAPLPDINFDEPEE